MGSGKDTPVATSAIVRAIALAVLALLLGITMRSASRKFTALFADFGAELPGLTRIMMAGVEFAPYVALPLFLPGFILLMQRRSYTGKPRRMVLAAGIGFALYALAFGVFLYAMYLPIFRAGALV